MKRHSSCDSLSRDTARVISGLGTMPMSRREALRRCLFGAAGLLLADGWGIPAIGASPVGIARSVIQIWLWGGPSHIDTFDPKPEAGYDFCGPLSKTAATNVDGIEIGELLPLLSKQADKYSIIRSMTHGNNGHETAAYMVQTGRESGGGGMSFRVWVR